MLPWEWLGSVGGQNHWGSTGVSSGSHDVGRGVNGGRGSNDVAMGVAENDVGVGVTGGRGSTDVGTGVAGGQVLESCCAWTRCTMN